MLGLVGDKDDGAWLTRSVRSECKLGLAMHFTSFKLDFDSTFDLNKYSGAAVKLLNPSFSVEVFGNAIFCLACSDKVHDFSPDMGAKEDLPPEISKNRKQNIDSVAIY